MDTLKHLQKETSSWILFKHWLALLGFDFTYALIIHPVLYWPPYLKMYTEGGGAFHCENNSVHCNNLYVHRIPVLFICLCIFRGHFARKVVFPAWLFDKLIVSFSKQSGKCTVPPHFCHLVSTQLILCCPVCGRNIHNLFRAKCHPIKAALLSTFVHLITPKDSSGSAAKYLLLFLGSRQEISKLIRLK